MRINAVDRRKLIQLTTFKTNSALDSGTPISTSWLTDQIGPNNSPVYRTQMASVPPSGGWSWGSYPGFQFPVLSAGTNVTVRWFMRSNNVSQTRQISINNMGGTSQSASMNFIDTLEWQPIIWTTTLVYTTTSHQIRRNVILSAGVWVDMTLPLIEIMA